MSKNSRLNLNANGGAQLIEQHTRKFREGIKTINLPNVDPGTSSRNIDLFETGKTPFGSLVVEKADVHAVPEDAAEAQEAKRGATLKVRSSQAGDATFVTSAEYPASVGISHRLVVRDDGTGEFASKANISNNSKRGIKNMPISITAGDTNNQGGGYYDNGPGLEAVAARSFAKTTVSAEGSTVYRFDLAKPLTLAAGAETTVSLYNEDKAVKDTGKELNLNTGGNYHRASKREGGAGQVNTTYTLENIESNGMGIVAPGGGVQILSDNGTVLSNARMQNTSNGEKIVLNGGTAFDLTATRKQTAFSRAQVDPEQVIDGRLGNRQQIPFNLEVSQEIKVCSKAGRDECVNITEQVPQSDTKDRKPTISNVKVDGEAVNFAYDQDASSIRVEGINVPKGGEAKLTFDVSFVDNQWP